MSETPQYQVRQNYARPNPTFSSGRPRRTKWITIPGNPQVCHECMSPSIEWSDELQVFVCADGHHTKPLYLVKAEIAARNTVSDGKMFDIRDELLARYSQPGELVIEGLDESDIVVSENICRNCAMLATMVRKIEGWEPYTPFEFLVMAHTDEQLFWSFLVACNSWQREVTADGNPTMRPKIGTSTPSVTPSGNEPQITQTSSSETIDT